MVFETFHNKIVNIMSVGDSKKNVLQIKSLP